MNIWATERRLLYIGGIILFLAIVVALPTFFTVYRPPSCTDGKLNQGEAGVDCGGPCKNLCPTEALAPIVSWRRFFEVSPGVYSALAYIQNPNVNSIPKTAVPYSFKFYDSENVQIAERVGEVEVVPNRNTPVFEPNINVGTLVPTRVTFELGKVSEWVKIEGVYPNIVTTDPLLTRADTSPKLSGTLVNKDFVEYRRVPVIGIIYDTDGNAIAASRTVVDYIGKNDSEQFFFTWPKPFKKEVGQRELVPILFPLK
jgi:hypothetical protein